MRLPYCSRNCSKRLVIYCLSLVCFMMIILGLRNYHEFSTDVRDTPSLTSSIKGIQNSSKTISRDTQFKKGDVTVDDAENPDFEKANNVTGFPFLVVPNMIHLIHFGEPKLNFGEMLAIKSAMLNHKPEAIMIHCDNIDLNGHYWDMVKDIPNVRVLYKARPSLIFGKTFGYVQHASDVARLEVLMEFGGIYLDSDVYVVNSLDKYRHFEFAIGWAENQYLGNQILIANKNARFLKLYYETYRNYRPDLWYYNGGQLPTTSVLYSKPHLVHRVHWKLGNDNDLVKMLFEQRTNEWRNFDTIHLMLRHVGGIIEKDGITDFNEENIKTYKKSFGDMARLAIYGSTDIVKSK